MKILCVGDVVGTPGLDFLCRRLPGLKRRLSADICIVNGENAHAGGVGITRSLAEDIFAHGADVITTGNHALRRADEALYEETEALLCPANLPHLAPGAGRVTLDGPLRADGDQPGRRGLSRAGGQPFRHRRPPAGGGRRTLQGRGHPRGVHG